MIRTHSSRYTRRVPMRARAPQQRLSQEPIPGVSRRCECGTVARIRQDGSLFAHKYCIHAPATDGSRTNQVGGSK